MTASSLEKNAAPYAGAVALLVFSALAACSGGQPSSPSGLLPQQSQAMRVPAASPTPISFTFQTVDDSISTGGNQVNAIDDAGEIVGNIGNGKPSNPYQGYSAVAPYSTFVPIPYTGAAGIVITGLSVTASRTVIAGYVIVPPTLRGTWGYDIVNGIGGLTKDRKAAKGSAGVTEILGVNDSQTAVGFYVSATTGVNTPFVLYLSDLKYTGLKPPGGTKGAEATGINDNGDIVGWTGKDASSATGFFERLATYHTVAYPGANATQALSVNKSEQVAGSYFDSSEMQHGFILTGPTQGASGQVWQSVDVPNAQGTVITGINDSDDICGYYYDSNGAQHGFVAVPSAS